jgi:hypothetical protein
MSIDEFLKIIPVSPPTENRKMNPSLHNNGALNVSWAPCRVANHLKILIPVGIAITIVAAVKYARVSTSIPTVNIWWAHTTNPRIPIADIA